MPVRSPRSRTTALLGLVVAALAASAPAAGAEPFAPSNVPSGTLTLVGSGTRVNAFARHDRTLYLGGAFSGVGYRAPNVAPLAAASGDTQGLAAQLEPINPGAGIAISAVAAAPDGGAYVAGPLAGADGVARPRLLRLTADGQIDTAFRPAIDVGSTTDDTKNVTALALSAPSGAHPGGILYMSGPFRTVGGQPAGTLAAVDAQSGDLVATFRPPSLNGTVTKLAAGATALYAAGTFTTMANGAARRGLAAFSTTDGSGTAWDPQAAGTAVTGSPLVADLAVDGDVVYLAGQFTGLRGADDAPAARKYLAAVDARGPGRLIAAWNPAPDKIATTLAVTGDAVYAGGFFGQLGGAAHTRLGAVEPAGGDATGRALPWAPTVSPDAPNALATDGERVFVGLRSNLYDPADPGAYEGTSLAPSRVDGRLSCGIVAVDADPRGTGALVPSWDAGLAGDVGACDTPLVGRSLAVTGIAAGGGRVWLRSGGSTLSSTNGGTPILLPTLTSGFAAVGVQSRLGLAAYDIAANRLLPWAPRLGDPSDTSAMARALAVSPDGATVFVGGTFPSVAAGGTATPRANAAAFTTAGAGTTLDWNPAPNGPVRTLAVTPAGDRVYLGGSFDQVAGLPRSRMARVVATGAGAPTAWYAFTTQGTVYDLALGPAGQVFAGGTFTRAGGAALAGVAALDPTTGSALAGFDAGLRPDASGATPQVFSLAYTSAGVATPRLVLGGLFGTSPVTAVDPATGAHVDGFAPALATRGTALYVSRVSVDPVDGTAYLSGAFTSVGGQARSGVAAVTPQGEVTAWDPAQGGTSSLQEPSDPRPAGALLLPPPADDPTGPSRIALGGSFKSLDGHVQPALALFASAAPPTPATPPAVAGSPTPGATLTCAAGTFGGSPGSSTWAWLGGDDGTTVLGTGQSYVVRSGDLGVALRCRQTLTNAGGSATQTSAARTVALLRPEIDVAPSVAGDAWAGGVARCTTGLWRNGPQRFAYRWKRDGAALDGETGETHRVGDAEQGHALACEVTASNAAGDGAPADSAPVTVTEAPPVNGGAPRVTGEARVGVTLTCDPGAWTGARAFAYAWLRDGAELGGETGPTHPATSKDLGHALRCLVTASNRGGAVTASSGTVVVVPAPHTAPYERPAATAAGGTTGGPKVDLRRVRLSSWTVVAHIAAPAAGRLAVTVASTAERPVTYVRRTATAARRGTITIALKLGPGARRRVARAGARGLKTTVAVTFAPKAGGAAQRDRAALTLRAPKRR